jgi:hypothetical protein
MYKIGKNKKRTEEAKELKALKLQAIKELGLKLRADGFTLGILTIVFLKLVIK